jgi:hypothetical protein
LLDQFQRIRNHIIENVIITRFPNRPNHRVPNQTKTFSISCSLPLHSKYQKDRRDLEAKQ